MMDKLSTFEETIRDEFLELREEDIHIINKKVRNEVDKKPDDVSYDKLIAIVRNVLLEYDECASEPDFEERVKNVADAYIKGKRDFLAMNNWFGPLMLGATIISLIISAFSEELAAFPLFDLSKWLNVVLYTAVLILWLAIVKIPSLNTPDISKNIQKLSDFYGVITVAILLPFSIAVAAEVSKERLLMVVVIIIVLVVCSSIYICKPNKIANCGFVVFIKSTYIKHKTKILMAISIVSLLAAAIIAVIEIIRSSHGDYSLNKILYNTMVLLAVLWYVLQPSVCAKDIIQECAARYSALIVSFVIALAEMTCFFRISGDGEDFAANVTLFWINSGIIVKVLSIIGVLVLFTYGVWASYDIVKGYIDFFKKWRQGCNQQKSDSGSVWLQISACVAAAFSYIAVGVILFRIFHV
jgi:hypothetical protein